MMRHVGKSNGMNIERSKAMSQLLGIIQRLISLQEQKMGNNEAPQRNFEVNGEKKCSVTYYEKTNTFVLEVYEKGEKPKSYQFDNIDMIAIEIFELLN
jgi:uncharacterized protein YkuJ